LKKGTMATGSAEGNASEGPETPTAIGAPDIGDDPVIEDLSPATIEGVATRLASSTSFAELVSRECELDALWTLCDIELTYNHGGSAAAQTPGAAGGRETLLGLRALIGEALSALAASNLDETTRLVLQASSLAGTLR
jgi:hypothetical protein